MKRLGSDRVAAAAFLVSMALGIFAYGVAVGRYRVFPYRLLSQLKGGTDAVVESERPGVFYRAMRDSTREMIHDPTRAHAGLNLVARTDHEKRAWIEIVTMDGEVLHRWEADWGELWPDPDHVPADLRPNWGSERYAHGVALLPGGDVVFNLEHLGLIRVDRRGEPVWRLPYQTHHSLEVGPRGNLWVSGQRRVTEPDDRFPDRRAPFDEYTIVQVSPQGELMLELSVPEILLENGYGPLLHSARRFSPNHPSVVDDRLHLNDVEPFPATLEPGLFGPGQVAVSLRNVNTVFVVDVASGRIEFLSTGRFSAQHDPDFISGDEISIFDNEGSGGGSSRIVVVRATDNAVRVAYEGEPGEFFTEIMGKHQWLPNGNLLVTESREGRAFEVTPAGDVVWQYVNEVEPGVVGTVTEVTRLSPELAAEFAPPPSVP